MSTQVIIRAGRAGDIERCRKIDLATQQQFVDAGHPEPLIEAIETAGFGEFEGTR